MIHESIVEYIELIKEGAIGSMFSTGMMKGIEWAFLISGGLTVAYITKLYVVLFVEKNNDTILQEKYDSMKGSYMNRTSAFALTVSATLLPIMGVIPDRVMNTMADMGQGFMQFSGELHAVHYFSFINLKGGLTSIVIGAVIYLLVVRLWLIKKEETGIVYLNRWKSYLDLENVIYRPILLKALPFAFGVLCRVLDSLIDTIIVLLRKTIYRDSKLPHELEEGTLLTHITGCILNTFERAANITIWKKHKKDIDFEHKFALLNEELSEDSTIIGRSLSFGLLLFCIGLIVTVVYLLL